MGEPETSSSVSNPQMLPRRRICRRLIPLLAVAATLTACSARRPPPPVPSIPPPVTAQPVTPPVDIPGLIERGCFACLQRALAEARVRNAHDLVFEAAVLLALRAKELGLPHQEWMDTAARAAEGDPQRTGLLGMAAAVPVDPLTGAREETLGRSVRVLAEPLKVWLDALPTAPGSQAFRSYVELALRCNGAGPVEKPEGTIASSVQALPLIRYRLGVCGNAYAGELRSVRAADPEFVDVDYPLARYALQRVPYPDVDEAIRLLESAAAAFPASPAIATSLGDVYQGVEEWTAALRGYDKALGLVMDHPDALRGRTMSLSSLNEHLAAIDSATRLVNGRWFRGDGYYWRAWNHFQLGNLDTARADADAMKGLMINSRAYLLSGLIDWRLRRLESAETEFEQSIVQDRGQCEAATFLGGVRNERGKSPEALAAFTIARQCWELVVTLRRRLVGQLQTSDAPEAYKTREIAKHERAIALAEKRRDEAAYGIELLQKYLTSIQAPQTPRRQ
jgi:tetratricopeptide (TPR) repeat protein